ncbi:MAG: reverse transcriptase-like protein [Elusimicrobia bacterium]|nr:reverse transcriptase-like protein [Elusimicrobiota bacterium]
MALYRKELEAKVIEFQKLISEKFQDITFHEASFKDYLSMFSLKDKGIRLGKVLIYYKPSKKTFSLKLNVSDAETSTVLAPMWDKLSGQDNYEAASAIYEIYVDGSYIEGKTGYGAVIFLGDDKIAEFSGAAQATQFRQFAGELKAVIVALNWCKKNSVKKARVNYDYEGVEKFALLKWKAKNEVSQYYADYMQKLSIEIQWRHIKSHTGNAKNDLADALAKKGALEREEK